MQCGQHLLAFTLVTTCSSEAHTSGTADYPLSQLQRKQNLKYIFYRLVKEPKSVVTVPAR